MALTSAATPDIWPATSSTVVRTVSDVAATAWLVVATACTVVRSGCHSTMISATTAPYITVIDTARTMMEISRMRCTAVRAGGCAAAFRSRRTLTRPSYSPPAGVRVAVANTTWNGRQ